MGQNKSWSQLLIDIDEEREKLANTKKQIKYWERERDDSLNRLNGIRLEAEKQKEEAQKKADELEIKLNGLSGAIQKIKNYESE